MSVDSAHKSSWEIAEIVFGIPYLISIAMNFIIPFSLPQGFFRLILIPIGIVLMVLGIAVIVLSRREFAYFSQPTDPGYPTSKVVKTGIFAISRNPLYLASVMLVLGLALAQYMLWALVMLVFSIIICRYVLIIPEERYLAAKFDEEYREYTASVHRWLGRK